MVYFTKYAKKNFNILLEENSRRELIKSSLLANNIVMQETCATSINENISLENTL